jgi:hypothetical protein
MPSKSPAQARLMAAAAHDPGFAVKVGVPQSVATDFNQADKGGRLLRQQLTAKALRKKPSDNDGDE